MSPGHASFSAQVQVFATTRVYCSGPPLRSIHSEMEPDSASSHTGENSLLETITANCCNMSGYCAYAIQMTSTVSIHMMYLVLQGAVGSDTASAFLPLVEEGGT